MSNRNSSSKHSRRQRRDKKELFKQKNFHELALYAQDLKDHAFTYKIICIMLALFVVVLLVDKWVVPYFEIG